MWPGGPGFQLEPAFLVTWSQLGYREFPREVSSEAESNFITTATTCHLRQTGTYAICNLNV